MNNSAFSFCIIRNRDQQSKKHTCISCSGGHALKSVVRIRLLVGWCQQFRLPGRCASRVEYVKVVWGEIGTLFVDLSSFQCFGIANVKNGNGPVQGHGLAACSSIEWIFLVNY